MTDHPDRISDLPRPILHRILSLLTTKDVTRTSVLSKPFRSTWISFPIIDLDCTLSHNSTVVNRRIEIAEEFFNSVLRTIEQRRGLETDLQTLRLRVPLSSPTQYLDCVNELISFGLSKKVRNLAVDLNGFRDKHFLSLIRSPSEGPSDSVQTLTLSNLWLKSSDDLISFPTLKILLMKKCSGFEGFKFSSSNIRSIKLIKCADLKSIEIKSLSLRKFVYKAAKTSTRELVHCEVNISDCKFIQKLSISNVSSNWVEQNVANLIYVENLKLVQCNELVNFGVSSERMKTLELVDCDTLRSIEISRTRLPSLESLKLDSCSALEGVKIEHDGLYRLKVTRCRALQELHVDTPRLVSFAYKGYTYRFSLFNSRAILVAKLSMKSTRVDGAVAVSYFSELRDLVGHFDHINDLTLACRVSEDLIFPDEVRWERGPTLCDLKHLKVQCERWPTISTDLVDSLIWLSPHLDTLSFVSDKRCEKSLKFEYERAVGEEEEDQMCCYENIMKCWRHSLKRVEIKSFDPVDAENLENYFRKNAKLPVTICKT